MLYCLVKYGVEFAGKVTGSRWILFLFSGSICWKSSIDPAAIKFSVGFCTCFLISYALFYLRCSQPKLSVLCFSGICPEFPLGPAGCRGGFHSRGGSKWSLLSHAHDSASWSVILQRFRWQCTLSLHGKCVVGFTLNKFWYVEVKSKSLVCRGFRKWKFAGIWLICNCLWQSSTVPLPFPNQCFSFYFSAPPFSCSQPWILNVFVSPHTAVINSQHLFLSI